MRVPVYEQKVAYRSAQAKMVPLARAQKESSGHSRWAVLKTAGEIMTSTAQTAQAVGEWFQKSSAPKSASSGGESTAFSSAKRGELLHFCKERAFAPQDDSQTAQSPTARLDEFFAGQNTPDIDAEDLLVQDYALLRRELEQITLRQERAAREEAFAQGVAHLLQTAALISAPKALESYLQSNLRAIETENQAYGSAEERKAQKQALFSQCIAHNVRAALQTGQTEQAENVYRYFADQLHEPDKARLQSAVSTARAEEQAQKLAPGLYPTMRESGETDAALIRQTAIKNAPSEEEQALLQRALTGAIEKQLRQDFSRRAETAAAVYESAYRQGPNPLSLLSASLPEEVAGRYNKAFAGFSSLQTAKNYKAFNQTYGQILDGEILSADLAERFDKGQISGAEFLLLETAACRQKAGLADLEEKALFTALTHWCARKGLAQSDAEKMKYYVFTSGNNTQARLSAAQKIGQIFQLQESQP